MRYEAKIEGEYRPQLIVEVVKGKVRPSQIDALKKELFDNRCANGMILDKDKCYVLHDEYSSMDVSSIKVRSFNTDQLLEKVAVSGSLELRVLQLLQGLSRNWNQYLPTNQDVADLVYDVVPAVSGSLVEEA